MQVGNNPSSAMLKELAQAKDEAVRTAETGEGGNPNGQIDELPPEAPEVEASASSAEGEEAPAKEASAASEGESGDDGGEEEPIRIGGHTFKNQREAFAWAEQQERERELAEAHAAGIRETLEATRQPTQPDPEPEDDFEQRFYSNPKETLREVQARARDEAVSTIKKEMERERLWNNFLQENPDIRRKDAERVLQENWETIGRMTDLAKAQKALATKVRAEYEEIVSLTKPRTQLSDRKQTVSAGGNSPRAGVTPRKEEAPLDFASQLRANKR